MSAADEPALDERDFGPRAEALRAHGRRFDASSLLDFLAKWFPHRRIVMRSQPSLAPAATLFDGVEVYLDHIVVRVNLGLRSGTTPLPSYFLDLFEDPSAGPELTALVDRLDGGLLPTRLAAYHLDAGALLPLDPERARLRLFTLAQPASPSTLHWLFAAIFPELEVRVERSPLVRILPTDEAIVGEAMMGVATLGGEAAVPVNGFDAVLRTSDSVTWGDKSWRREAHFRVHAHILPALAGTGAYLRVLLVDLEAQGLLALGPNVESYLGFDPLAGLDPPKRAAAPLVTIVFDGQVPAAPVAKDELIRDIHG
ncbi:MAG: hypothetical protein ACMG6S_07690 [Byssovorax sp.]